VSDNPEIMDSSGTAEGVPGTVEGVPGTVEGVPGTVEAVPDTVEAAPEAAAEKPVRRLRAGRIAAVAGSVLLAAALVGGAGYTVVTVQDAERDPGKPTWKLPQFKADEKSGTKKETGLSALFLPFDEDGYYPGPDVGEFGNDTELSGQQATALRKEAVKDLPASTRRKIEKLIDKQRIQGMAMRSYHATFGQAIGAPDTFSAGVTLQRMANRTAVRTLSTSYNEFLAATDVLRKAPAIKGHEDAQCFLTPKGKADELESAFCSGYVGDILVTVDATGPSPLSAANVAALFTAQLDRIDDPGQAV
jgi:hypothetical protein